MNVLLLQDSWYQITFEYNNNSHMLVAYDTQGDAMILKNKVFANDILPSLACHFEFWQCSFGGERGFPCWLALQSF